MNFKSKNCLNEGMIMSCYFMVTVYVDQPEKRVLYNEYIAKVKPVVESYGGEYLVRSEKVEVFAGDWKPDRIIVIRFPDRNTLECCFGSEEYRAIASLRTESVRTQAVIIDED